MTSAYLKGFEDGVKRLADERSGRVEVEFFKFFAPNAIASGRISDSEAEEYEEGHHAGFVAAGIEWAKAQPRETGIVPPRDEPDDGSWNPLTDPPRE